MNFLRFPDESTGMAALDAAGLLYTDDDGVTHPLTASHTHALDCVGRIYRGGTYDPETGDVIDPPVEVPGWHVNFQGDLPEIWQEFIVDPVNPVRVWA